MSNKHTEDDDELENDELEQDEDIEIKVSNFYDKIQSPVLSDLKIDVSNVEIYNITGQLVKSFTNVISDQELDITNLNSGIYLVKMTNGNGTSQTKKLIKE